MDDVIEIDPEYPLKRFTILPEAWTAYTSAAALCLVLPLYHRGSLPARAREVLAAGLDRYAPAFNEGDALELVGRAERYLAANLSPARRYALGALREMLRLHAGRLLEGRGREALTSAVYLATHVLSQCGDPLLTPGELWVLNEAVLDARPIASIYQTVDNAEPGALYRQVADDPEGWMPGVWVRVPVGRRHALFQVTQLDALSYECFAAYRYGLEPSWPLRETRAEDGWIVPFADAVDVLDREAYPALDRLLADDPERFTRVPEVLCAMMVGRASVDPELERRFKPLYLDRAIAGVRALEYALGELRRLDMPGRWILYNRLVDVLKPSGSPLAPLIGTVAAGVLALSKKAQHYPTQYFMPE